MLEILGWILWLGVAFLCVSFAVGCRLYAKRGQGFQWGTAIQTLFWWILAILFLVTKWNKLHLIWLAPAAFFAAPFLALGTTPILSPLIRMLTYLFMQIVLLGISDERRSGQ